MDLGTLRHETVFDTIEGSGNISMPIAARPRRSAVAATSWRRKRWASPSSRISLTATFMAGEMRGHGHGLAPRRAVRHLAAARHRDPPLLPAQEVVREAPCRLAPALHDLPR